MRVEVEEDVWSTRSAFTELQRLMRRAATGQHKVEALIGDPSKLLNGDFFRQFVAQGDRVEWHELLRRTLGSGRYAGPPAKRARVSLGATSLRCLQVGFDLAPADLGAWSERPLSVLLENDSDWLLVRLAARLDEDPEKRLDTAITHGWIVAEGRGGTGELLKAAASRDLRRRIAVIDSDRDSWDDPPRKQKQSERAADSGQVAIFTLRGRELENYLPKGSVSGQLRRAGPNQAVAARARENHLWARIQGWLARERDAWVRKHGAAAVQQVEQTIKGKLERRTSAASQRKLFREHLQLDLESRAVDDLKARLGGECARWVERTSCRVDELSEDDFDALIVEDLRRLARHLVEWL